MRRGIFDWGLDDVSGLVSIRKHRLPCKLVACDAKRIRSSRCSAQARKDKDLSAISRHRSRAIWTQLKKDLDA